MFKGKYWTEFILYNKKITHMKLITFITHWAVKIGFYERSCVWEPPCISVRNIKKRRWCMQPHIYCMYMKSTTERNRFSRDAQPTRQSDKWWEGEGRVVTTMADWDEQIKMTIANDGNKVMESVSRPTPRVLGQLTWLQANWSLGVWPLHPDRLQSFTCNMVSVSLNMKCLAQVFKKQWRPEQSVP